MAYSERKTASFMLMIIIITVYLGSYGAAEMEIGAAIEVNATATVHPEATCLDIKVVQLNMDHGTRKNEQLWNVSVINSCPFASGFRCGPANIILHSPDFVTIHYPPVVGSIVKLNLNNFLVNDGHAIYPQKSATGYYLNRYPGPAYTFNIVSFNTGCEGV